MEFQPTWLYIKQHNKTGLKYFGKTIRDPITYLGSGVRWRHHLRKHGDDVTTTWCQLFLNKDEIMSYALTFSKENNIVESKEWANLMPEDGLTGGNTGITDAGRKILSERGKNRRHSRLPKIKEN